MTTPRKRFTRQQVLARITEAPIRFGDLAGSKSYFVRSGLRPVVDKLTAEGLIRIAYIDGRPHLVLKDWDFSEELKLQVIENKCRRKLDGCLEWTGYVDPARGPMACIGKEGVPTSVRRMVWQAKRGPLSFQQTVRVNCDNDRCVQYAHLCLGRREDKAIGRNITQLHRTRVARVKQEHGKLDWDKVRAIRARVAEGATDQQLADDYGVAKPTIANVRRHESWREEGGLFTALIPGRATA